jgi:putative ATP-dependent endonuclease of OLD family
VKISEMHVTNYRCFGAKVSLKLDENNLVVLCGKNNSGKSTLLSAYEMFVTAAREALSEDFFQKKPENNIQIELAIRAEGDDDLENKALKKYWDKDNVARIRKTWKAVGEKGEKESFAPDESKWIEGGAGGFDTLLQHACPAPVWIKGSQSPEDLLLLLKTLVQDAILKELVKHETYQAAIDAVSKLDELILRTPYAVDIQTNMNQAIGSVFPGVKFKIKNEPPKDVGDLLKGSTAIEITENDRPDLGFSGHGHGVRRQFVLSTLRGLAMQLDEVRKTPKARKPENFKIQKIEENKQRSKSKMLLFEEPELFLHPSAIRSVRNLLFTLANHSEFQIMAATHSAVLIDLSRPHTTLVRVTPSDAGSSVTQVSNSLFSEEDRERMKMLNYFDPFVCEAFFADKVILVEGDTEAVALRCIMARMREIEQSPMLNDIHVVNCGTKMNLPFFQNVLTHFSIPHFVFHDIDSRLTSTGAASPAWTMNERIWLSVEESRKKNVSAYRFVFDTEFESAHGYVHDAALGKPYSAFQHASAWDLTDIAIPAVRYLRAVLSGKAGEQETSQDQLEKIHPPAQTSDAILIEQADAENSHLSQ